MSNPLIEPKTKTLIRPRYTISHSRGAFAFNNYESLPSEILRPMLWNKQQGFTELLKLVRQPLQIYTIVDWEKQLVGAIYQVNVKLTRAEYYWWMYGPEIGVDKQPHVREHYWVKLKEGVL
jgi:hypothetical protein